MIVFALSSLICISLPQERFKKMLEMQEKFGVGESIVTPSRVGIMLTSFWKHLAYYTGCSKKLYTVCSLTL